MKICYIANSKSSHTVKWVNYFVDLGHEVHVISHSKDEIEGAVVHYIDYCIRNFMFKVREIHNLIRSINPDIIHAHQANTCGLYATSIKGYKVIVSAWGSDILVTPNESFIMKKIVQYVLRKAYFITSDSEFMTKKIIELGGSKDKCYTFPMGVEELLLNHRHIYNKNNVNLNILSNRRLEKIYNIDIIIKGFKKAVDVNKNLRLNIAADGSEINSLKKLVKELDIIDKVNFIGKYNFNGLCLLLEENDIFISIPESDSTSVSLLEAMCCGLYPVVCDLPANREWVKDKDNGVIIEEISDETVKNALLWCYENRDKLEQVSEKNINIIKEKALWKNNAKIVENLYNKILQL